MNRDMRALQFAGNNSPVPSQRDLILLRAGRLCVHQNRNRAPVGPRRHRQLRQSLQDFFRLYNFFVIRRHVRQQSNLLRTHHRIGR